MIIIKKIFVVVTYRNHFIFSIELQLRTYTAFSYSLKHAYRFLAFSHFSDTLSVLRCYSLTHYHSLIVVWDAAFVSSSCLLTGLVSMCIRMKHFSVYMASAAGSVFTCGHLSPLVLPNTLANEAGLLSLWWLSLYYFIHYLLSSREIFLIIICLVCECECFPFINSIKFLQYVAIKDGRSFWGNLPSKMMHPHEQIGFHNALMLNSISVL